MSTRSSLRRWLPLAVFVLIAIPSALFAYEVASMIAGGTLSPTPVRIVPLDTSAETLGNYSFSFREQPADVPNLSFVDANNRPLTLSAFRGRPVLLNIWATWCVPCRKEMPSLDRLQAKFDISRLQVVAISIDHEGLAAVKRFYDELGLKSLGVYLDPSTMAANRLGFIGVPGTLLIDAQGREIGRKLGPAEWDSTEVVALLSQHLHLDAPAGAEESSK